MWARDLSSISALMQSFYTEFFGAFIPGFIAVVSVVSICIFMLIYCGHIDGISRMEDLIKLTFNKTVSISLLSSWTVFGVICAFSYAVGAIIYRRAPKVPDAIASYRQWRETRGKDALAVNFDRLVTDGHVGIGVSGWPFSKGEAIREKFGKQIDYPYPHLRQYLAHRGHHNLLKYVPWCADSHDDDKSRERSKTQINTIKRIVSIEGSGSLSRDLIRNESHIRLLSSLWYIFRFLQELFVALVVLLGIRWFVLGLSVRYNPFVVEWSLIRSVHPTSTLMPMSIFSIALKEVENE